MADYSFGTLDLNNSNEIKLYEEEFYHAFAVKTNNTWVVNHNQKIGENRLRANIPYDDQRIYTINYNHKLAAAAAVNIRCNSFQFEKKGFTLKNKTNICEGLNTFFTAHFPDSLFLELFGNFTDYMFSSLKKMGFDYFYGTARKEMLNFYTLLGFEEVDQRIPEGIPYYLLKAKL